MFNEEVYPQIEPAKRRPTPRFLVNTYELVNDPKHSNQVITWTREGLSFVVLDVDRFCKEMLPMYFNHSKFESFVRQLNMYGFAKAGEPSWKEFSHPDFRRGQPQLLDNIVRQRRTKGAMGTKKAPTEAVRTSVRQSSMLVAPMAPSNVPQAAVEALNVGRMHRSGSADSVSSSGEEDEESEYMPTSGTKRNRSAVTDIVPFGDANDDAAVILAELRKSKMAVEEIRRWANESLTAMSERLAVAEARAESAERAVAEIKEQILSTVAIQGDASPDERSVFAPNDNWAEQQAMQRRLEECVTTPAAMAKHEPIGFDLTQEIMNASTLEMSSKRMRVMKETVLNDDLSQHTPQFDLPINAGEVEYSVSDMGTVDVLGESSPHASTLGAPRMS